MALLEIRSATQVCAAVVVRYRDWYFVGSAAERCEDRDYFQQRSKAFQTCGVSCVIWPSCMHPASNKDLHTVGISYCLQVHDIKHTNVFDLSV